MAGQAKAPFYAVVALVVVGLVAFAGYRFMTRGGGDVAKEIEKQEQQPSAPPFQPGKQGGEPAPVEPVAAPAKPMPAEIAAKIVAAEEIPKIGPPGEYQMKDNTLDVEISDWPGYAPIIVANGGLEPNEQSYFFRKHGFKLRIAKSEEEEEAWDRINGGRVGVSSTTADVLALYASQLKVEVPLQLDFSRGGDGIITRKDITSINQLKGKILAAARYTEADFFIRFLAHEAGLEVNPLANLDDKLDPQRINLLFTKTTEDTANVLVDFLDRGDQRLAGAVVWSPHTVELPDKYPEQVRLLTTNRNLLVVADVLIVNSAFAKKSPQVVQGLTEGILQGVEMMRTDPEGTLKVAADGLELSLEDMRDSLTEVHLSNYPENVLFFSPEPGRIGNFNELYYSAVYAYGRDVIKNVIAPEKIVNRGHLEAIGKANLFADQKVLLAPVKSEEKVEGLEKNPLLTKQIRFQFQPNSTDLALNDPANQQSMKDLTNLLKLAPGSYLVLRGHLDNSKVEEFKQRGQSFYNRQAVRAVEQSKLRAESVKQALVSEFQIDADRLDTEGRGWDEPLPGGTADENRRVEVQWFTLE